MRPVDATAILRAACLAAGLAVAPLAAAAFQGTQFDTPGADSELARALVAASALRAAEIEDTTEAQDIYAAARAEYGRLLGALYARGHYSAVISVRLDGREAAEIAPFDIPARIDRAVVRVEPGPRFTFDRARVAPLPPGTELPDGFAPGRPAESGLIRQAAEAGVDAWRSTGRAKARVAGQDILADHPRRTLSADIALAPGPVLRFGRLTVRGEERMRMSRILAIAGYPEGQTFSPEALEVVAERLRRTGVFRSVALQEDEGITAPDLLGVTLTLSEERLRRYTVGAEVSSLDGMTLSGSWLHRNLFGGAERFRVEGEVAQIGARDNGMDHRLGLTIHRPADIRAATTASLRFGLAHVDDPDGRSDRAEFGLLLTNFANRRLTWTVGIDYADVRVRDQTGQFTYRHVSFPLGGLWEDRDNPLDARRGVFAQVELRPFLGFDGAGSGLRAKADVRAYRSFGDGDRVTFAGRLQAGAVTGSSLLATPREFLFRSGGGGTVRGHPFQSLGIPILRTSDFQIGGQAFLAASVEARVRVTDTVGIVGFYDWGHVGALGFFDDLGDSHAGAGIGLRYDTGIGPIRLDVAQPVSGRTGRGTQIYVGIGQSF
ncbi:MAG TPA: BamA/TamA family outer membrane protein [Paracoccaceae bacterium]|nr:BamA/TamA family outer membrane protein [Paracoccaceae bacterium]